MCYCLNIIQGCLFLTKYVLFLFPEIVVFLTQGTTGKPKGVTLSHGALIIQSLAKIAIVGYNVDDVCYSVLHEVHVIGYENLPLYQKIQNTRLSILRFWIWLLLSEQR